MDDEPGGRQIKFAKGFTQPTARDRIQGWTQIKQAGDGKQEKQKDQEVDKVIKSDHNPTSLLPQKQQQPLKSDVL